MMKQGVRSLLVRRSVTWKGMSKRFSVLYNGKWLKNHEALAAVAADGTRGRPPPPSFHDDGKFCCLSREDVVRFLIGRLGALAPLPLCSIDSLGAFSPHYAHVDASSPALDCARRTSQDPYRVAAVVEVKADGTRRIIGEISAYKLQRCDYLAAAWAIRNCTAGQFVLGFEEGDGTTPGSVPDAAAPLQEEGAGLASRARKFSSRSIGFVGGRVTPPAAGGLRSVYGGRSTPLLCKRTSSLAAVMAQMLSHRATHVWVVDPASDDALVGIAGYTDILNAVTTRNPAPATSSSPREQP